MTMNRKLSLNLCLLLILVLAACSPSDLTTEPTLEATTAATVTAAPPNNTVPPPATVTTVPTPEATPTVAPTAAEVVGSPTPASEGLAIAAFSPSEPITLSQIQMLDATGGWAVGQGAESLDDHILMTGDGGATWDDVTPPQPLDEAASLGQAAAPFFLDGDTAWVTYYDRTAAPPSMPLAIWHTEDGGASWAASQPLELPATADYFQISDLNFVDKGTGWALMHLGAGMSHDYVAVYRTTDGGATWEKLVDPDADGGLAMSCGKTGMAFANESTGWVLGDCGGVVPGAPFLYRTDDGGQTWTLSELPAPADLPTLFAPDNVDYACGVNWLNMLSPTEGVLITRCLEFNTSANKGWLYATNDGGETWNASALPGTYNNIGYIVSAKFLSLSEGWVISDGDAGGGYLQHTTDGGATWTLVKKLGWIGQLDFVDSKTGWAVAQACPDTDCFTRLMALVKTADGGGKWSELKPEAAP